MATTLRATRFTDLYIGSDFADLAVAPGSHAERVSVDSELMGDVEEVRARCEAEWMEANEDSFAVRHDDVLYRVNVLFDARDQRIFILRRVRSEIQDFRRLGLPAHVREQMLDPARKGLFVFVGDQRSGKTTSAAALIKARLEDFGGFALVVEDPTETELDGLHGKGRCIQSPAVSRKGGYREQLRRAMRTGVGTIFIGEIRCQDSAMEAIRQAINGTTVISTVHGQSIADGVARIVALANMSSGNSREILSMGLAGVIHQTLERVETGGVRMQFRSLMVQGPEESAIRSKVRDGRFSELLQEVQIQQSRRTSGYEVSA